jgi:hypothetical protein
LHLKPWPFDFEMESFSFSFAPLFDWSAS